MNPRLANALMRIRPAFVAGWLKKILRVHRREVTTANGSFYIDPVSQFAVTLMSQDGYEPRMLETLGLLLHPGAVFVDAGANEGYFSVVASRMVGARGRVIAVEPQARLQPILQYNLKLNRISNVTVFPCAISDTDGDADIFISPSTNTGTSALQQSTRYRLPRESVHTTTLSTLFDAAKIEVADLVKMDIEGFEYEAITGSAELLKSHRIKALALEMHPAAMAARGLDPTVITRLLQSSGYVAADHLPTNVWLIDNSRFHAVQRVRAS